LWKFKRNIGENLNNENWVKIYIIKWHHFQSKILRHWVCRFSLIYCSIFLLNMRLRLTLGYLTIFSSSESPSFTLIHSPLGGSKRLLTCTAVHTLIRDTLAWNFCQEDFRYKVKLYSSTQQTIDSDTTWCEIPRGNTLGRSQTIRTEPKPI